MRTNFLKGSVIFCFFLALIFPSLKTNILGQPTNFEGWRITIAIFSMLFDGSIVQEPLFIVPLFAALLNINILWLFVHPKSHTAKLVAVSLISIWLAFALSTPPLVSKLLSFTIQIGYFVWLISIILLLYLNLNFLKNAKSST